MLDELESIMLGQLIDKRYKIAKVIDRINTTSEGTNNDNCALSLDEDEEEVVFVDDSFAG